MELVADLGGDGVTLEEADDFGRFHVRTTGSAASPEEGRRKLAGALAAAGAGRLDPAGADAFISQEWLRRTAAAAGAGADWERSFEGMLSYARTKGWVAEADGAIQAHVIWEDEAG